MRFTTVLPMLLAAGVVNAQFGQGGKGGNNGGNNGQNNGQNNGGNNGGGGGNLALNPANVQKASAVDGLGGGAEAGQAASKTDQANFINFCQGKTLTNGLQVKQGSCNGIGKFLYRITMLLYANIEQSWERFLQPTR
jgi:transcription initiation factor TFIID subunit 15